MTFFSRNQCVFRWKSLDALYNIMCGFVRALLFIYILFICVDSAPYFLDPPFPPLAYIGQSYDIKFNVRGLPQLTFTF